MLKIYLTNLGKYNEGYLIGEWVTLPITNDELEKVKQRIGINKYYEEYFITDYECSIEGLEVNEYSNIYNLIEIAQIINEFDEMDLQVINALLSVGYSFSDAIDKMDDCIIHYNCKDMEDVAYSYIEEMGLLDNIPEFLVNYFDYKAFARDISFTSTFVFTDDGKCIEIA